MAETFEITGAGELQALAGRLKRVPVAARAQTAARMGAVGELMKTAVQANALAIPASGETATGLRQALAAATKVRTTVTPAAVSVHVAVDPTAMPQGQEKLPALMEGPGWTHQVFGNPWTAFQRGHPYFRRGVDPLLPLMRDAEIRAVDEATRTI